MDQFMDLLTGVLPLLLILVGLLICGMAGFCFPNSPRSEQRWAIVIASIAILLGITGIIWKDFVYAYPVLVCLTLLYFAGLGVYRVLKRA